MVRKTPQPPLRFGLRLLRPMQGRGSDTTALWESVLRHDGFAAFAQRVPEACSHSASRVVGADRVQR
jgi:hypothetical protein